MGISVLFGLIAVVGTAFLTREIICEYRKRYANGQSPDFSLWGQALAALLVGVNSLAATSSRLITPDIPMLAFFTWGLWVMLKASSLSKPVGTDCGPILLPVALAGIAVGWLKARRSWWLIVPVLVVYIAEVSRWRVYADRYLLPALPILAALSGLAMTSVVDRIKSPTLRTTTGFLLFAILVVPPLIIDIQQTRNLLLPDTRTSALEWVERNIPSGAKILLEIGGPQPADLNAEYHRDPSFDIAILPPGFSETSQGIDPSSALDSFQPDYVITSSNYRARYGDEYARRRFPRVVAAWERYYSRLDTSWNLVYEIKPQSTSALKTVGPDIWIYHRRNGL